MKRHLILHPFLFAILPSLFLYSHNITFLSLNELLMPLVLSVVASVLLWMLLALLLRDGVRAALLCSLFWVWFFSSGPLYAPVRQIMRLQPGESWLFLFVYCTVLFAGGAFLLLRKRGLPPLSSALNIMAAALVAWQLLHIGPYEVKRLVARRHAWRAATISRAGAVSPETLVNIYYIVLDGYAREDILKEVYQYDNSDFIHYLTAKGFHVARNGKANYCQTMLSLASTLNLDYLGNLGLRLNPDSDDRQPLVGTIEHNRLFDFLRRHDYRIIAFPSGYSGAESHKFNAGIHRPGLPVPNEFRESLLGLTPIPLIFPAKSRLGVGRSRLTRGILYTFDHLPDATRLRPPVFVFAHILCPHPPFVFDRNGEDRSAGLLTADVSDGNHFSGTKDKYVRGYREQLLFVNRKMKAVLDKILEESKWPTVIIIQSDHGPGSMLDWENPEKTYMKERLGALIAYRLPGGGEEDAYDELSAVNIFRIVLNRCFGTRLELLPNESYYSTWSHPYRFIRVTDQVNVGDEKP